MQTHQQSPLPLRPRLVDQVRDAIRRKHYSLRTEQSYIHWIKRFIFFHGKRHPAEMGAPHVTKFLNHLATNDHVAAATQNQALAALLFLYREVLEIKLPWLEGLTRAKLRKRLPTVLTQVEAKSLLSTLEGTKWLMVTLLYGTGMRLNECLNLRIKDIDFERRQIFVRDGKGGKDRVTLLPTRVMDTTSMKRTCSVLSRLPPVRRESTSLSAAIVFAIQLQRTCWKMGSTFEQFRN